MKKEYQAPFINVVKFETESVLNISDDSNFGTNPGYTGGGNDTTVRPFQ